MADATPVTKADKAAQEPAKADERVMPPVQSPKAPAPAPKAKPSDLEALVAEAEASGKKALIVGNAVRVDN
jgi:hypothetical protein